jgi:hypothetical protein
LNSRKAPPPSTPKNRAVESSCSHTRLVMTQGAAGDHLDVPLVLR